MRHMLFALTLGLTSLGLAALPAAGLAGDPGRGGPAEAGPVVELPSDTPTEVNGVEAACTGIGQTRNDPRWADYAVRVEVSDHESAYLADAVIGVFTARGRPVLQVSCDSPWLLLDLAPGRYVVRAEIPGSEARPRSSTIVAPARGQIRVVLQFPDA